MSNKEQIKEEEYLDKPHKIKDDEDLRDPNLHEIDSDYDLNKKENISDDLNNDEYTEEDKLNESI